MKGKTKLGLVLSFILFASILFVTPVSAGEFTRLLLLNDLLTRSNDYDIVWEGPYKGGNAIITFSGGKSSSALSDLNVDANNVDVLRYERANVRAYGSTSYSYPRYSSYGGYYSYPRGRYGSFGNRNYFRDNSERLFIDNTVSNMNKADIAHHVIDASTYPRYVPERGYYDWRYSGN